MPNRNRPEDDGLAMRFERRVHAPMLAAIRERKNKIQVAATHGAYRCGRDSSALLQKHLVRYAGDSLAIREGSNSASAHKAWNVDSSVPKTLKAHLPSAEASESGVRDRHVTPRTGAERRSKGRHPRGKSHHKSRHGVGQ